MSARWCCCQEVPEAKFIRSNWAAKSMLPEGGILGGAEDGSGTEEAADTGTDADVVDVCVFSTFASAALDSVPCGALLEDDGGELFVTFTMD